MTSWRKAPVHLTREWVVFCVLFAFTFMGLAIFAAVKSAQVDNRVTREAVAESVASQIAGCVSGNVRRDEARTLAEDVLAADQRGLDSDLSALASDRASWESIDALFDDGIPEPARGTVFDGLDARRVDLAASQAALDTRGAQIDTTYEHVDCSSLARSLGVELAEVVAGSSD